MDVSPISAGRYQLALVLCALWATGCVGWQTPRIDPSGQRIFLPPEAAVIDPCQTLVPGVILPQESILLSPGEIIAPVGSEVVMLAGVRQADGRMWSHQRVEWMLDDQGVGQFVTLGDRDSWHPFRACHTPRKYTNHFAVGTTSPSQFNITRGTPDVSDDVNVLPGQSWVSVTSPTEGVSRVTAYAPQVTNWDLRKATGSIYWVDAQWVFPSPAINPVGTNHVFTTNVSRQSNNTPLAGWLVRYEIIGGPPAGFAPNGASVVEVATDELGQASVEIAQQQPQAGTSRIGIQVIRPADGNFTRRLILGTGTVTKTWTSPELALRVTGPAAGSVGATLTYQIAVTNPGDLPAREVNVTSDPASGLMLVSSNPPVASGPLAWNVGDLGPRETRVIELNYRAEQQGSFTVCASARAAEGLTASDCASTTVTVPSLNLQIAGPATAQVGSQVRYEVTVSNLSQVPATGLVITDRFDPGFQHMAATSPIERNLEDIEPGQSRSIFITFNVVQAGEICHTVEVSGAGGLQAAQRACLTATAAPVAPPITPPVTPPITPAEPEQPTGRAAVGVTKTGPQQMRVGQVAEFFLVVTNSGEVPLTNVRVIDSYDLALDPVNASAGFTVGREQLIWVVPSLAPGQNYRIQVNCQCVAVAARACNRVTVESDQRVSRTAEACLEIFPQQESPSDTTPPPAAQAAQLRMTIAEFNDPLTVGQEASYRVFVTNIGQSPARNVQLAITLPPEMTPVATGTAGPVRGTFSGQTIRFGPIAEVRAQTQLRAADALNFTVRARAVQPGRVRVLAELTSDDLAAPLRVEEGTQILGNP